MIALCADGEDRNTDIGHADRAALHRETALGEIVIQQQTTQILAVHAIGQPGGIGVPGHQI